MIEEIDVLRNEVEEFRNTTLIALQMLLGPGYVLEYAEKNSNTLLQALLIEAVKSELSREEYE